MNCSLMDLHAPIKGVVRWIESDQHACQTQGGKVTVEREGPKEFNKQEIKSLFLALNWMKAPIDLSFRDLHLNDREFKTIMKCAVKYSEGLPFLFMHFTKNLITDKGVINLAEKITAFRGPYLFLDLMENQTSEKSLKEILKKIETIPTVALILMNQTTESCEFEKKIHQISNRNTAYCSLLQQAVDTQEGKALTVEKWRDLSASMQWELFRNVYKKTWEKLKGAKGLQQVIKTRRDNLEIEKTQIIQAQFQECILGWNDAIQYYGSLDTLISDSSEEYLQKIKPGLEKIEHYMNALKGSMIGLSRHVYRGPCRKMG